MENQITDRPTKFCKDCGEEIDAKAEICPKCGVRQESPQVGKNKVVAGLLAIFLGGFGIHKFYLGKPVQGILYIFLFFFFGISVIISFIEGIIYLTMSDEKFNAKYNRR
jgi:TM2 domain-containing membrane protein YozV